MAHDSRHARRRSTRSRRRLGFGLVLGLIATILTFGTLVPAFADDGPASTETNEATPTTQPTETETTTPQDPPPTTQAAQDPPPVTQPKQDPPQAGASNSSLSVDAAEVNAEAALNIPLHNDEAEPGTDCPADGKTYWHFVIVPNNNNSAFVTFHLNLGDGIHTITTWVPNGGQNDNVFVEVPAGYTLLSLDKTSSDADISWNGVGNEPDKFNLSHTCPGTPQTGGLNVTKSVVGSAPGGATFSVHVDCDDGTGHDKDLTFDSTGALTGGGPLPITGIPTGTSCTVTEPGQGGADSVLITGSPAVIAANQTSQATVTNIFNEPETGSLQVRKITEGVVPPGASWQVTVTCTSPSFSSVLTFGPNDLGPKTVSGIALSNGSNSCSVAETDQGTPPPTLVTVTPNSAQNVTSAITPVFTVTNRFQPIEVGGISVTPVPSGVVSVARGTLPFTGSPTAMLLKIAALLLALGAGALLLARNRRRRKLV